MIRIDRRAVFFFVAAIVCALLVFVTPEEFRWVGNWMAIAFVLLGLASWMDDRSRQRWHRRD
jgi:predicted Na+-dependent transporter